MKSPSLLSGAGRAGAWAGKAPGRLRYTDEVGSSLRFLAALWAAPLVLLWWASGRTTEATQHLFVEPAALCGVAPDAGLLSNLGVALWIATAAVLLFAADLVRPFPSRGLLWPGALSLMLGLDDGLMLHEALLPHWLGVSDQVVQPALYALYGALLLLCLREHNRAKRRQGAPFLVLWAAALCLGSSVAIDVVVESGWLNERHRLMLDEAYELWWEDGLKLLGITAWAGYWISFARISVRQKVSSSPGRPEPVTGSEKQPM